MMGASEGRWLGDWDCDSDFVLGVLKFGCFVDLFLLFP